MHDPGIDIGTCPSEEFGPIGKMLMVASKWLAIAGGIVLVALVVMSVVSIVGRKLWSAPVPGDVEVLQLSAASSVWTFFAWCHLTRGDVKVDFFTNSLPRWAIDMLDGVGSLLLAGMALLLGWRATVGALSVRLYGETSTILAWPVWIPQILMVPGFVLLAASGFYMAALSLRNAYGSLDRSVR